MKKNTFNGLKIIILKKKKSVTLEQPNTKKKQVYFSVCLI